MLLDGLLVSSDCRVNLKSWQWYRFLFHPALVHFSGGGQGKNRNGKVVWLKWVKDRCGSCVRREEKGIKVGTCIDLSHYFVVVVVVVRGTYSRKNRSNWGFMFFFSLNTFTVPLQWKWLHVRELSGEEKGVLQEQFVTHSHRITLSHFILGWLGWVLCVSTKLRKRLFVYGRRDWEREKVGQGNQRERESRDKRHWNG